MASRSSALPARSNSSASSDTDLTVRRETWDQERARLVSYFREKYEEPDEALDHALDVLDGKVRSIPCRPLLQYNIYESK
jgi:hypothetical protein